MQQVSAGLTREQRYTVDRMVEAHRLYRAEDGSHSRVGKTAPPSIDANFHFCPPP